MTDLSKIKAEFITLSSLSEEDAGKYQSLIEMECEYINSLLKSSDDENNSCVIFLCAAKAYYRYMLTNQTVSLRLRQEMCHIRLTRLLRLKMQGQYTILLLNSVPR